MDDDIFEMIKALADKNRLQIFEILQDGEICACRLLDSMNISQPTLSHHMKVLIECGLVNGRKDAQWMRYTLNKEKVFELKQYFSELE